MGRDVTHEGWGSRSWGLVKGMCMDEKLSLAPMGKPSTPAVWFVLKSRVSLWLPWPKTFSHNGPGTERLGMPLAAAGTSWTTMFEFTPRLGPSCLTEWEEGISHEQEPERENVAVERDKVMAPSISSRLGDWSHGFEICRNKNPLLGWICRSWHNWGGVTFTYHLFEHIFNVDKASQVL